MWLLIGGSGFIGTNFAWYLKKHDIDFQIYDIQKSINLPDKTNVNIGDIRDNKSLSRSIKDCDIIFHLATVPPSVKLSDSEIYNIDVNGTKNVILLAEKYDVKKIIYTSSASHIYGITDFNKKMISEDTIPNPINEYGKNKVVAENLFKNTEITTIILRLSMVIGAYINDPIFVENVRSLIRNKNVYIPGDGNQKSQSIHVDDIITIFLKCAKISNTKLLKCNIFNLSAHTFTLIELLNEIRNICESQSKIRYVSPISSYILSSLLWRLNRSKIHPSYLKLINQNQVFDTTKIKNVFNWTPKYSLNESLIDTISYLKSVSF